MICPTCGHGREVIDLSDRPLAGQVSRMLSLAAYRTGFSPADIKGDGRSRELCRARWAIMWAARKVTGHSTAVIGRALGSRDHTTVLSGLKRAASLREIHPPFRELTDVLVAAFNPVSTEETRCD